MAAAAMAERRALIVASGSYADPKFRELRAPAIDAAQLAAVLGDPAIGNFKVDVAANESEGTLRRRIARFYAGSHREDVLLLHLSCHGVKDAYGGLYLAASDTEMDLLDATALSARWLDEQLSRSPSRHKLLLLDCCFSGKFPFNGTARGGGVVDIHERLQGKGRAVITASSAMEYAYEGDELVGEGQPSYFTAAVVEALQTGEADRDQDEWISVDELYDYIFERVRERSPGQTPTRQIALEGPLYVARSNWRRPVQPPQLDDHLLALTEHPLVGARLGAVDELTVLLTSRHVGVTLAARRALERMVHDDSRRVGERATQALNGHGRAERETAEQARRKAAGQAEHKAQEQVQSEAERNAAEQAQREAQEQAQREAERKAAEQAQREAQRKAAAALAQREAAAAQAQREAAAAQAQRKAAAERAQREADARASHDAAGGARRTQPYAAPSGASAPRQPTGLFRPGVYTLGPNNATLSVRTRRAGAAAKAGHDLLIVVSAWSATLYVAADPARSTLILDAAPTSMRVREGTGGVKVLSARDKSNIQEAIAKTVTKQLPVSFGSTSVSESADGSQLSVQGELELAGSKHPVDFTLAKQSDGKVTGSVVLKQTDWNIKPYSAFRDTFRVQNDVEVGIEISVDGLIGK